MKVLNLYAGIGGNRKLWEDVEVTAVEINEQIAQIYQDNFPNDKVIVGDAHQYLLEHYKEFDFIWSSVPCPTHSRARFWSSKGGVYSVSYPDMSLYQEIILLTNFFKGLWAVENVEPYYGPIFYPAKVLGRHWIWSNFNIQKLEIESNYIFDRKDRRRVTKMLGFDIDKYNLADKIKILRNCVHPELGLHILDCARGTIKAKDIRQLTINY